MPGRAKATESRRGFVLPGVVGFLLPQSEVMMKWLSLGLLRMASGAIGQVLPPQTMATAILGAGKVGAWDTKIVVADVSTHPFP